MNLQHTFANQLLKTQSLVLWCLFPFYCEGILTLTLFPIQVEKSFMRTFSAENVPPEWDIRDWTGYRFSSGGGPRTAIHLLLNMLATVPEQDRHKKRAGKRPRHCAPAETGSLESSASDLSQTESQPLPAVIPPFTLFPGHVLDLKEEATSMAEELPPPWDLIHES